MKIASWRRLEASWRRLEASWRRLGGVLGVSWEVLEGLGESWESLGGDVVFRISFFIVL